MDEFIKEVIPLLQYILPGFLTAWLFYGLTAYPRPSQFERIIQALIFTFLIHGIVLCIRSAFLWAGELWKIGFWSNDTQTIWLAICAFVLGLMISWVANNDILHSMLRKIHCTNESSFPTNWYGVFANNPSFVVLHLKDERRLYGWPALYPSSPDKGHFAITYPMWLTETGKIDLKGVKFILVDVTDIEFVEFVEDENGNEVADITN